MLGIVAGLLINQAARSGRPLSPWLVLVLAAGVLGSPIFTLLGGIALFASLTLGNPPLVMPMMAYQELTTSTGIAAIPLFTVSGFLLAEGQSSERLLRVFRAWVGWMPGGTAIAAAALCAFFTLFTGGSGVTILVLGGLLLPALVASGYRERFSIGLLTASGSLGLLFPLSLPLMLYGIVSQKAPIEDLFIGGLLPGLLMLGLLAALGIREGIVTRPSAHRFARARRGGALGGEVGAFPAGIRPRHVRRRHRDAGRNRADGRALHGAGAALRQARPAVVEGRLPRRGRLHRAGRRRPADPRRRGGPHRLPRVRADPDAAHRMDAAHVHSKLVFLLCLNVFLLLVGTLMDIFSAIVVVVPLILPLAEIYGINLVHLGIIFVANLELGFLHPPLGLNLLLASVRFKKPVLEVTWATLPMLGILAVGVLLITYWPWLTLGILHWMGRV